MPLVCAASRSYVTAMEHEAVIQAATTALTGRVETLFLAGSHGRGTADIHSDIDFVAITAPDSHEAIAKHWRETLEGLAPIVFWNQQGKGSILLNAVTDQWLRIDLFITGPETLKSRAKSTVRSLIETAGHFAQLPQDLPPAAPNPRAVTYQINEFIRVLGLTPVCLGRGEYVTLVKGTQILRDLLTDLMLQECDIADKGGILHLSSLLPPEDIAILENLPYPGANPDEVIQAHKALAEAFLPRARTLAKKLDLVWPEAFEAATRRNLEEKIGLKIA